MIKIPRGCVGCSECRFWIDINRQQGGLGVGECRLGGPQMGPNGNGFWPVTVYNDFCFKCEKKTHGELLLESMITEDKPDGPPNTGENLRGETVNIPPPPPPPPMPPKRRIAEDVKIGGTTTWPLNSADGDE